MVQSHEHYRENLAPYAFDALESGDVSALEAHLRTCKTCPPELESYRQIGAGLLSALPPRTPPARLRWNLQKRLAAPAGIRRPWFQWSVGQFALGAALTVLIGLSIFSVVEVRAMNQQQADLERASYSAQTAIAMLAYPGTQSVTFDQNGVSGSLLVDKTRNLLAIFAWHLPPPPVGKTYEVWLIDSQGNRTSGGFLVPEASYPFVSDVIRAPSPLTGFTGIGVTTEPLGGSPAPTGPKLFGADF